MDLNTVASQWRSSYEGFVRTSEAVEEVIENYEEETKTRFVVDKKDKLFGSKCDGKLNYRIYTIYVASPIWSQVGYIYIYICVCVCVCTVYIYIYIYLTLFQCRKS